MKKRSYTIFTTIPFALALILVLPLLAQGVNNQAQEEKAPPEKVIDPVRTCSGAAPENKPENELTSVEVPENANHESKMYHEALEKLLKDDVENLKLLTQELAEKRKLLAKLTHLKGNYHEIQIENLAGYWYQGRFQSLSKILSFTFTDAGDIDCIVLDRNDREIDYPENWTRKVVRIRYPDLNTIEIETHKENYDSLVYLGGMDVEIRRKAISLLYMALKNAGYTMDIQIAAARSRADNNAEWKVDI